jgi:hypothetical protein
MAAERGAGAAEGVGILTAPPSALHALNAKAEKSQIPQDKNNCHPFMEPRLGSWNRSAPKPFIIHPTFTIPSTRIYQFSTAYVAP